MDTYLKYVSEDIDCYHKQSFFEQKVNSDPEVFKKISLNYLKNIGYLNSNRNNEFFRTFYSFRLFAGDGPRFEIPDKALTLKKFNFNEDLDKVPKVIFSGITDVLNNFLIDGIMGKR